MPSSSRCRRTSKPFEMKTLFLRKRRKPTIQRRVVISQKKEDLTTQPWKHQDSPQPKMFPKEYNTGYWHGAMSQKTWLIIIIITTSIWHKREPVIHFALPYIMRIICLTDCFHRPMIKIKHYVSMKGLTSSGGKSKVNAYSVGITLFVAWVWWPILS